MIVYINNDSLHQYLYRHVATLSKNKIWATVALIPHTYGKDKAFIVSRIGDSLFCKLVVFDRNVKTEEVDIPIKNEADRNIFLSMFSGKLKMNPNELVCTRVDGNAYDLEFLQFDKILKHHYIMNSKCLSDLATRLMDFGPLMLMLNYTVNYREN